MRVLLVLVVLASACGDQVIPPTPRGLCPCERAVEPRDVTLAGPSDVAYYVDGVRVAAGALELGPGWHLLGVEAAGYSTFEHDFYRPAECGLDLRLVFGPPTRVEERLRCTDADAIQASIPVAEPPPTLLGPPTQAAVESHVVETRRWSDRVVRTIERAADAAERAQDLMLFSCLSGVRERARASRAIVASGQGEDLADRGVRDHVLTRTRIAAERIRDWATEARACVAIDCACADHAGLLR